MSFTKTTIRQLRPKLVLGMLATATGLSAQTPESFEWSGELAPGSTLQVFTVSGRVDVQAAPGQTARVEGRVRTPSRLRQSADLRFESIQRGNVVTVCAMYEGPATCTPEGIRGNRGSGNRSGSADFTVRIPRGVELNVSSGNGDVRVDGATASVRARSGNGDLFIGGGATTVDASSGNGRVEVVDARAEVRASTGNGPVTIATRAGPVSASSGNGRIEARIASLTGSGDMSFRTGNGSVHLYLPDGFNADLTARTGRGSFHSDFPMTVQGTVSRNRITGTIGSGGRRLQISSGNGNIEIRRSTGR